MAVQVDKNEVNWKDNIKVQIALREASLSSTRSLYQKCSNLSERYVKEVQKRKELENELKIFSSTRGYMPSSDKDSNRRLSADSTAFYQKRIAELEAQVSTLKDERSELYKNQGQNAQRLLDMTDIVKNQEELLRNNAEEIQNLKAKMKRMKERTESSIEVIKEKDKAIQILQDELTTSHLELTKIEERLKQLKAENSSLLQRWLKKMNEEAETMNLANLLNGAFGPDDASSSITDLRLHGTKLLNMGYSSIKSPTEIEPKEKVFVTIPNDVNIRLKPHSSEINTVQFSSEGSLFATGSTDKKVNIYNSSNGKVVQTFTGSLQSMNYVEFNTSDEYILGASNDNSVRIWNLKTGKLKDTLTGHIGKILSAKFTYDSSKILSGSHDRTLKLWDLHRSICTRTVFTFSSCNDVCVIDSDATNVASGHLDHTIRIWDMKSGNCIKELSGFHSGQITSISVSPDGTKLLSNSRDNTLKLFDLRTYEELLTFEAQGYRVPMNWSKACFSPDGRFVTAGSVDGGIYHWDANTGQFEISHTEHSYPICALAWSPQGHQMLSVDKERNLYIWGHKRRDSSYSDSF